MSRDNISTKTLHIPIYPDFIKWGSSSTVLYFRNSLVRLNLFTYNLSFDSGVHIKLLVVTVHKSSSTLLYSCFKKNVQVLIIDTHTSWPQAGWLAVLWVPELIAYLYSAADKVLLRNLQSSSWKNGLIFQAWKEFVLKSLIHVQFLCSSALFLYCCLCERIWIEGGWIKV